MKRYAFIDVSNTKATTGSLLGFNIDWVKLFDYLKGNKWQCVEAFYYEGSMETPKYEKRHDKLAKIGYKVISKKIFLHKNKERTVRFVCKDCKKDNSHPVTSAKFLCEDCNLEHTPMAKGLGSHAKANFDVELTVDALEYGNPDNEILLFTGDGDFRYLAEKLISRGAFVTFISSTKETLEIKKRFSTRLRDLIREEEVRAKTLGVKPRVRILEVDNWRKIIEK